MAVTTEVLTPLSLEEVRKMDAYWRACNYLAGGHDLSSRESPPPRAAEAKSTLIIGCLGTGGSDPGQSFVWVHLNRLIRKYDLNVLYISGPGHGAPATLANCLSGRPLLGDLSG